MEIPDNAIVSFRGPYKFLSNFSYSPFVASPYGWTVELTFRTNEHYFQASKALNFDDVLVVVRCSSPRSAKSFGNRIARREHWEEIKLDVMLTGLKYKFKIPNLADELLLTGDRYLIEGNTWNDRYWGCTIQGNRAVGENHLGRLLMQVRDELRQL